MRQAKETTSFVGHFGELGEAECFADRVEQIAVLACGGIGPFAGGSLRRDLQPNIHGAARRVANIANLPIVALASTGVEIVSAHRLGLIRETAGQIMWALGHHWLPNKKARRRRRASLVSY